MQAFHAKKKTPTEEASLENWVVSLERRECQGPKCLRSTAELIVNIVTRDHWLGTKDNLGGRFRRVIDEGAYWSKSVEELDEMLAERDAELKGIYFNILRQHQLTAAGKDNYSVEMMRQSVVQLRQALKQDWEVMLMKDC